MHGRPHRTIWHARGRRGLLDQRRQLIRHDPPPLSQVPMERTLIVCDDLDLALAKVRLRLKGSDGGHNGLRSIIVRNGGSNVFPRLKIGGQDDLAAPSRPSPRLPLEFHARNKRLSSLVA